MFPAWLLAQPDSTRVDTLRAVTISATRLPVAPANSPLAVTLLEAERIRRAQPQLTMNESLAAVPGVFVLNDANFAQDLRISIRGFGARAGFGIRGIRILLDGIPESAPDGQAQVDNLDMAAVGRIEVLRGASGGLYGNASGGVISLQSDTIAKTRALTARLAGGQYGFRQFHAKGSIAVKNSGLGFSITHVGLDGYRDHATLRSTFANGRWFWTPDSSARLSLLLNYANSPRADDPGALTLAQVDAGRRAANPANRRFNAGESVRQGRAGLVYEKKWPGRRHLQLRGYSTWRDFENRLGFQNSGQVVFQRWFAGGGAQYDWLLANWRFSAGADFDRQTDLRQRFDNLDGRKGPQSLDQRETFTSAGAYAQAAWTPALAWTLSGGARLDAVRLAVADFFDADGRQSGRSVYRRGSPWGGVVWRLRLRWQLYANATTNFETPALNELSNNPLQVGGFNNSLDPQRTISVEVGVRSQWPAGLSWEVACFRVRTRGELAPYELAAFPGRTYYRNAGQTLRQGVELALRWRLPRRIELALTGTYAGFRYKKYETPAGDFAGRRLPGIPRLWGMVEARFIPTGGIFALAQLRYTGRYYADDANAQPVEPYALVNARMGYRRGRLEVFLGADNLTGAAWLNNIRLNAAGGRYFEPAAGRRCLGGMGWEF
ncbi:MAG: TonB-dependent receptor [Saprospirales bacterium]|nr:TonB-dependent receptor [Saprospirales bacterium]